MEHGWGRILVGMTDSHREYSFASIDVNTLCQYKTQLMWRLRR
jgi:hypothetical protein